MDTIVIGAGLAGLAAAARLAEAGETATVLEARDRVGGRVWTRKDPSGFVADLGPEWVGGEGEVHDLLVGEGVELREAEGRQLERVGDRWRSLDRAARRNHQLVRRAARGRDDRSLLEALNACCAGSEDADARANLLRYVQGFHAADPERLSVRWLEQVETTQPAEASDLRPVAGVGMVVDILSRAIEGRCELRLGSPVRSVEWKPGRVSVRTVEGEVLQAAAAIVTVPLPLLDPRSGEDTAIRFIPALDDKARAAALLHMGPVIKIVLGFREPFWREIPGLEDALFLHAFDQPIPTWWTATDPATPSLTGWAGGPFAKRILASGEDPGELAIASLAATLGLSRRDVAAPVTSRHFHDWSGDPYSRGAYTYVGVGGTDAHLTLAAPVADTLFFAGEATCGDGYNATMVGAVRSGRRAASELQAARRR